MGENKKVAMGVKRDKALTDRQPRVGRIVRRCPATCKIVYCTIL